MTDPVSSGHTFERSCVHSYLSLSFRLTLPGAADFSTVIPNLALRSTIINWCRRHNLDPPIPLDFYCADKIVSRLILPPPTSELTQTPSDLSAASSEEPSRTPLPLTTRPSCYSSSCEIEITSNSIQLEEDELYMKMRSSQINEQEEALASLQKLTRTLEDTRASLCTRRILSALKNLITSRYSNLQVNAAAVLVNLSLERQNKVKIVRSGIMPSLIDTLRGRHGEAKDLERQWLGRREAR